MTRIRGNRDGPNGRNESYSLGNRKHIPRMKMVQEVEAGQHPSVNVIKVNGRKYIRDNADSSRKDNVNQE